MKKFLSKTILLLSVVMIPFLVVEGIISYRLNNNFVVTLHNDWHALKNHNAEILFIGNSRTWTHVDPKMVSEHTGASCEILAQDSQTINMLWQKFKSYLKVNKKPKEIYVLTDPLFLEKRHDMYRFRCFQSYLFMDRYDLGILKTSDEYRIAYKYLPLVAVREQALGFILNKSTNPIDYEQTKGFKKFDLDWDKGLRWDQPDTISLFDKEGIAYLDSFRNYCTKEDVRCYFICTPMSYPTYSKNGKYRKFTAYLNNEMGLYFSDFNGELYDDSTLFLDHRHLNARGVDVFMPQLLADTSLFKSFNTKM